MLYLDGRELIEFEDCGKRKKLKITEPKNSECLWDCTWRHNPFATQGAESFFEDDFNATDDHPHDSVISYITTPRVPEDLACLRCCLSKDVLRKAVVNTFLNAVIVSHRWPLKNVILVVV